MFKGVAAGILSSVLIAHLLTGSFVDEDAARPGGAGVGPQSLPVVRPAHAQKDGQATLMSETAAAFLATLSREQRARIVRSFGDDRARTNWSNLPSIQYQRDGVALAELTPAQRIAFHDLLAAAMSSQGYGKAATIMWFEDILREEETEQLEAENAAPEGRERMERFIESRQSDHYWITLFGEPGAAKWGWLLSGHHLVVNFTVVEGKIGFTPLFLGAEPQVVRRGRYAGWRVLDAEISRGFALFRSLDDAQRRTAKVADGVGSRFFTGKGRKDSLRNYVGLPASRLNGEQQRLLWDLVREFVGSAADEAAEAQLNAIRRDGLDKLHFAWWGNGDDRERRFMYRIHGPTILIEYVREGNGDYPDNHVHAIVRDPRNDYGEDWLGKHYTEQPHP